MNRRGFTLTELLMSLSVMAILGVALTRILISDSRFVSRQDAMLASRQSARAALNSILAELAMVGGDTAVLAATRDSLTVRVPFAFGISCRLGPSAGTRVVSVMPVDSLVWASMTTSVPGVFWRKRTGNWGRLTGTLTMTTSLSDSTYCRPDSVRVVPGGKVVRFGGITGTQPESLAVVMTYQPVTYKFAASTDLPGRVGLWRKMSTGAAEEIVTPFDTSARFAYLVGGASAASMILRTTNLAAASLDSVRGVELRLNAASENTAQGTAAPQVFKLKTRVRFANKTSLP